MGSTLQQLGELLLKAVPTFLLVILLNFYLKMVFFKPMKKVLDQRYAATEGARQLARQSLERAAQKTADYEAKMRAARAEVYQAQEQIHKQLQEDQAAQLTAARQSAEAKVQEEKALLARDVEVLKSTLARDTEVLANQIVESILRRAA